MEDSPDLKKSKPRFRIFRIIKGSASIFILALIIEYIVIPDLSGASKSLKLLSKVNLAYLFLGVLLEALALISYSFLTRSILPKAPKFSTILRINFSTLAVSHVLPGGTASGTALGFRLFADSGVDAADTSFTLATQGIGSAVVLNFILWVALIASIPFHSINNPEYIVAAIVGALVLAIAAFLIGSFTRGKKTLMKILNNLVSHLPFKSKMPFLKKDKLNNWVESISLRVQVLISDKTILKKAITWALANWLFDAASLYIFLAAFGKILNPFDLLVAYGLANVMAAIPITPGGLGVVEGILIPTLIGFNTPSAVATLAVLVYRFFNFWLPIPMGLAAYISLRLEPGTPWQRAKTLKSQT